VIYLARKNISRGKNRDLTDFSHLISKDKDTEEDNANKIKKNEVKEE
jgi:hypothetical protein